MKNKAKQTVKKYHMLNVGDSVAVGFSGGADSCALMHFLLSLREEMNLTIYACHINHSLRGQESDNDEQFVADFCRKYNVPLFVLKADVASEASKRKIGTEQCGREIRYEYFSEIAEKYHAMIATAHTASDNAETVLFHLARGSGIAGMSGIPTVRDRIIRPLIEVTREEIERYCRDNHISYVTDSTNLTDQYTRNKIRLEVIPVLKSINPSFENTVAGMSERMRETDVFIEKNAENALSAAKTTSGYSTAVLSQLPLPVFDKAIRLILKEYNLVPEASHIELIRKIVCKGGAVEIRKNRYVISKQGILRAFQYEKNNPDSEILFAGQKNIAIHNKIISPEILNISEFDNRKKNDKFLFHNSLDYDTIPLGSVFRSRHAGDLFKPVGRNITKQLRKMMTEQKIPSEQRDQLVVFASDNDVLWAENLGVSEPYKVTDSSEKVLVISTGIQKRKDRSEND